MSRIPLPSYAELGLCPTELFPLTTGVNVTHEASLPSGPHFRSSFLAIPKAPSILILEADHKWVFNDSPIQLKGKWDTTDEVEGSLCFSNFGFEGTQFMPWVKRSLKESKTPQISGGVNIGVANDTFNINLKTETPTSLSSHKFEGTAVFLYQRLFFGLNAQYTHNEVQPNNQSPWLLQGKLHWIEADSSATVAYEVAPLTKEKDPQLTLTWDRVISPALRLASSFIIPPTKPPSCSITAEHKWDSMTTVKSKIVVGPQNRTLFALSHKVTPSVVATFAGDLNANLLIGSNVGTEPDHSFGFMIELHH